jgi:hypothetical protein
MSDVIHAILKAGEALAYHRAAAARARRLRAEATTRWLKEHLEGGIAWHDQQLEEIERASKVGSDEEPAEGATSAL